jgi:DNA (cytosine-5)-methyltransferase 1
MADARQLTFIDFFSGIGGFRLGLELAGMKCIGFCESDKFAVRSYRALYDTEGEWHGGDIAKLREDEIPQADIWTAGSPCQNLSVAGRRSGLHGERSGLFFDFVRLLKNKPEKDKPEWVILENVKGLLSSNAGWDFLEYLCELDEAGYDVQWQVFNSKDYGVPQNRERVYTVGHLGSRGRREILSFRRESGNGLRQIIGGTQGYRVYDPDGVSVALASQAGGIGAKTGLYFINQPIYRSYEASDCCQTIRACGDIVQVMDISGRHDSCAVARNEEPEDARLDKTPCMMPVLVPDRNEKRQNSKRLKNTAELTLTLTGQDMHGMAALEHSQFRIRRLTPKECWRLQGFSDELFEKARKVNSDAQLYKQAGNAVTVNVAFAVAHSLLMTTLAEK